MCFLMRTLNRRYPTLVWPSLMKRIVPILALVLLEPIGFSGYMAPEYAMHGYLTDKADVYSIGIVALEIVSGRSNTSIKSKEDCFYLLDWARVLNENGNLMDLIDPRLGTDFSIDEALAMINIALLCTDFSSTPRPSMSTVVSMLEGKAKVEAFVSV